MCFLIFYQEKNKITPTKPSEVKRTRRERGEMENIIFKLFERQPNWALKQLVLETDQPEVCNYIFYTVFFLWSPLTFFIDTIHPLIIDLVFYLTFYFLFSLQQFLKEILNDLCVYNKRGPNQGTHELKPEYKKTTGASDMWFEYLITLFYQVLLF